MLNNIILHQIENKNLYFAFLAMHLRCKNEKVEENNTLLWTCSYVVDSFIFIHNKQQTKVGYRERNDSHAHQYSK